MNQNEETQNDEILLEKYNKLNSKVDPDSSISDNDVSISENDNITKTVSDILNNSQNSDFYSQKIKSAELGKIFEVEKVNFTNANESSKSSNSKKSSSNLNRSQNGSNSNEQTSKENLSDSTRETDSAGKIDNLE